MAGHLTNATRQDKTMMSAQTKWRSYDERYVLRNLLAVPLQNWPKQFCKD
jgi:hypothetical protein